MNISFGFIAVQIDPIDQATPEEGPYYGSSIERRFHRRQSQLDP